MVKIEPEVKSINIIYYSIWSIFHPAAKWTKKKDFSAETITAENKNNKINVLFGRSPSKNRAWLSSSC